MQKTWNKIIIVLDEKDRKRLTSYTKAYMKHDWTEHCHHVTLAYNDGTEKAEEYHRMLLPLTGSIQPVFCRTLALSDDIGAVGVYLRNGLPCMDEKPRITIGCRKTTDPEDTDSLTHWMHPDDGPGTLHGTLKIL